MAPRSQSALVSTVLFTALVAAPACDSGGGSGTGTVQDYVAAVSTADGAIDATYVAGALPRETGGPGVVVTTNSAVIPGGTTPAALVADAEFELVLVAIDGVDGYYQLALPATTPAAELIVTLSQELSAPAFDWIYGVGTAGGIGPYVIEPVSVVQVGTGDVQVSLSWDTTADVDLHVYDPAGEEIYWSHRESASGGALDLDSNAACGSDGPRNENITWPVDGAPAGTYRVAVDYWSDCGAAETGYTVTVNVLDQEVATFGGTFTGPGDTGGADAGIPITTFTGGSGARLAAPTTHELGTTHVEPLPGAVITSKVGTR